MAWIEDPRGNADRNGDISVYRQRQAVLEATEVNSKASRMKDGWGDGEERVGKRKGEG